MSFKNNPKTESFEFKLDDVFGLIVEDESIVIESNCEDPQSTNKPREINCGYCGENTKHKPTWSNTMECQICGNPAAGWPKKKSD